MNNFIFVSLDTNFLDEVCREVSSKVKIPFLSLKDYISYEILGMGNIESVVDVEYFNKKVFDTIHSAINFEFTIISLDYNDFIRTGIRDILKDKTVVYIKRYISNEIAGVDLFDERSKFLEMSCVKTIGGTNKEQCVNEMVKIIKNQFGE